MIFRFPLTFSIIILYIRSKCEPSKSDLPPRSTGFVSRWTTFQRNSRACQAVICCSWPHTEVNIQYCSQTDALDDSESDPVTNNGNGNLNENIVDCFGNLNWHVNTVSQPNLEGLELFSIILDSITFITVDGCKPVDETRNDIVFLQECRGTKLRVSPTTSRLYWMLS